MLWHVEYEVVLVAKNSSVQDRPAARTKGDDGDGAVAKPLAVEAYETEQERWSLAALMYWMKTGSEAPHLLTDA